MSYSSCGKRLAQVVIWNAVAASANKMRSKDKDVPSMKSQADEVEKLSAENDNDHASGVPFKNLSI